MTEIENEILPDGTDSNELFVDQKHKEITIPYKGKNWKFTIRQLSWREKSECIKAGTVVNIAGNKKNPKKTITMDMNGYNTAFLMKSLVKAPFSVTLQSFMKLDAEFGDLLTDAVIEPDFDDDAEGNSDVL